MTAAAFRLTWAVVAGALVLSACGGGQEQVGEPAGLGQR